jgi:hypothetical protein
MTPEALTYALDNPAKVWIVCVYNPAAQPERDYAQQPKHPIIYDSVESANRAVKAEVMEALGKLTPGELPQHVAEMGAADLAQWARMKHKIVVIRREVDVYLWDDRGPRTLAHHRFNEKRRKKAQAIRERDDHDESSWWRRLIRRLRI